MGFTVSHPEAKGECSQPGDEVGDQSEISVSKRMEVIGLSPWTSEMDMTLAVNFRVDTGDPRRRGRSLGSRLPVGTRNHTNSWLKTTHLPLPPQFPFLRVRSGQVVPSGDYRENTLLAFFSF